MEIDKEKLKKIAEDDVLIHTPYYNKDEKSKYVTDYTIELLLSYIEIFLKSRKE